MPIIRYAIPYVIAVAIAFALAAGCYLFGYSNAATRWKVTVEQMKTKQANDLAASNKALADAQQANRDIEHRRAEDMAALDAKHLEELSNAKSKADRVIADLRAGTARLQQRFRTDCRSASATAKAGTGTSVGNGQPACGLSDQDVQFLISEARRADEVAVQLGACQEIVEHDRINP